MTLATYQISDMLKDLLRRFGEVQTTVAFYATARPQGPVQFPGEHYPLSALEPDEPALIVRISKDGLTRIIPTLHPDGSLNKTVQLMELPEDEFWFFEAFRPALSSLSVGAPGFLFEMALTSLYGVFEAYVADVCRQRLCSMPHIVAHKVQYRRGVRGASKLGDVTSEAVNQEVRRITHGSITLVLEYFRTQLAMPNLPHDYDDEVQVVALVRNCLLHAGGQVDRRLSNACRMYAEGTRLRISEVELATMGKALRDLAYAIDREWASTRAEHRGTPAKPADL